LRNILYLLKNIIFNNGTVTNLSIGEKNDTSAALKDKSMDKEEKSFAENIKNILSREYTSDKKIIELLEDEKREGKDDLKNNLKEWDLRHGKDYINGGININNMKKKGLA
jgi:hypothetical protein